MTARFGVVVFEDCDGEAVEAEVLRQQYPDLPPDEDYVWARWRPGNLDELVKAWPARGKAGRNPDGAVWWQPTIEDLRVARKQAARTERRRAGAKGA